jgi:hypothetical protein
MFMFNDFKIILIVYIFLLFKVDQVVILEAYY